MPRKRKQMESIESPKDTAYQSQSQSPSRDSNEQSGDEHDSDNGRERSEVHSGEKTQSSDESGGELVDITEARNNPSITEQDTTHGRTPTNNEPKDIELADHENLEKDRNRNNHWIWRENKTTIFASLKKWIVSLSTDRKIVIFFGPPLTLEQCFSKIATSERKYTKFTMHSKVKTIQDCLNDVATNVIIASSKTLHKIEDGVALDFSNVSVVINIDGDKYNKWQYERQNLIGDRLMVTVIDSKRLCCKEKSPQPSTSKVAQPKPNGKEATTTDQDATNAAPTIPNKMTNAIDKACSTNNRIPDYGDRNSFLMKERKGKGRNRWNQELWEVDKITAVGLHTSLNEPPTLQLKFKENYHTITDACSCPETWKSFAEQLKDAGIWAIILKDDSEQPPREFWHFQPCIRDLSLESTLPIEWKNKKVDAFLLCLLCVKVFPQTLRPSFNRHCSNHLKKNHMQNRQPLKSCPFCECPFRDEDDELNHIKFTACGGTYIQLNKIKKCFTPLSKIVVHNLMDGIIKFRNRVTEEMNKQPGTSLAKATVIAFPPRKRGVAVGKAEQNRGEGEEDIANDDEDGLTEDELNEREEGTGIASPTDVQKQRPSESFELGDETVKGGEEGNSGQEEILKANQIASTHPVANVEEDGPEYGTQKTDIENGNGKIEILVRRSNEKAVKMTLCSSSKLSTFYRQLSKNNFNIDCLRSGSTSGHPLILQGVPITTKIGQCFKNGDIIIVENSLDNSKSTPPPKKKPKH